MLSPTPLRSYSSARERIDAALEDVRLVADAYAKLDPELRPTWQLDNLLGDGATNSIHLYDQSFSSGDLDGPALLAKIAEVTRAIDPEIADILRWVAKRGAENRREQKNESFVSPVNDVIAHHFTAIRTVLFAIAERWPEGQTIEALPEPPPFDKEIAIPEQPIVEQGPHPLERITGPIVKWGGFVFTNDPTIVAELEAVEFRNTRDRNLRSCLRMDPDGIIVDAATLDHDNVTVAITAAETGHIVVITGSNPEHEQTILKACQAYKIQVYERR